MKLLTFVNVVLIVAFADNISGIESNPPSSEFIAIPPRCTRIACPQYLCRKGYALSKLPTECCATCKPIKAPDCRTVLCPRPPTCTGDQVLVKPEGQCCERCELNCAAVSCLACAPGQIAISSPDHCCNRCVPDCRTVKCAQDLICPADKYSIKLPNECCAKCVSDCLHTLCLQPTCTGDQVLVKPEGECCERCELNCAAISCLACTSDQISISSPYYCCNRCEPKAV